jgi:2',3'-cyclic-nucleotide 2'-phosphodiesterase (5'-nucleotidase family)
MSNEKIYIYHTNDIHSNLTYWPRLANELREKRAMREANDDFVLAFDIGDATDRVNPLTEATDGQAITRLLNDGNYDAVTIGNNEGITNSKEELNHLYNRADFSVILTNLFDLKTNKPPEWATPYKIINTKQGDRIGVFGLTTPIYETYEALGWKVRHPVKQTQEFFKEHREEADFWILLSHLGIDTDRYLAKLFPIPLILGAHTHHALMDGEFVAGSTLTGAGQFGQWLGEIVIGRDRGQLKVERVKLLNTETDIVPPENEQAARENYIAYGHQLLKEEKIAQIPKDLPHSWEEQTLLADVALDAIADFAGTDAALLNAGLFMDDIDAGVVTADDFHQALPHPIRVMHCKIKGKDLLEFAKEIKRIDEKMINQPVRGFGFRGRVFGKMCLKGLSIDHEEVLWLGEAIDIDAEYELATIDYFSFLPFFDTLNKNSTQTILFPDFLRTVVGEYFKKIYPYKK